MKLLTIERKTFVCTTSTKKAMLKTFTKTISDGPIGSLSDMRLLLISVLILANKELVGSFAILAVLTTTLSDNLDLSYI